MTGPVDAVRLEARDATIEGVLTALKASYGLQFRSATPLSGRVSGFFEGSLSQVVARVLDRYNYVMKREGGIVEVAVLGSHYGTAPSPPLAVGRSGLGAPDWDQPTKAGSPSNSRRPVRMPTN